MREIKFRAWDEDRMVEVVQLNIDTTEHLVRYEGKEYITNINREKVMQYTGLTDKDNNEIYEDDMVWDAHNEEYGEITFTSGEFLCEWETHCESLSITLDDIEVIGNIHQHPELLEDN